MIVISVDKIDKIKNLPFLNVKNIFNFDKSKFSINKFYYRFIYTLNIDSNKKKIYIEPISEKNEEEMIINFFKEYNQYGTVNKNLKLDNKNILSSYLKKTKYNW